MGHVNMILLLIVNLFMHSLVNAKVITLDNKSQIEGATLSSYGGRSFSAFQAIPYAKPPSGTLRFKAPQAADAWKGLRNGSFPINECPQKDEMRGFIGDEDCLQLNVYFPDVEGGKLLPVIVFFHGGGFVMGSGSYQAYGPEKWMDHDVVLVVPNYRLGILGFLNTGDANAEGNYGLLDQVLALRWVQHNIKSFGGDHNKVTIVGHSAGSASVIYHLLSPLSTGLFHRAVAQSATPFKSRSSYQPYPLNWAKKLAKNVNCSYENNVDLVECFRGKTAEELVEGSQKLLVASLLPSYCAPSVGSGENAFITEDPVYSIQQGKFVNKVPIILGSTTREFALFLNEFISLCKLSKTRQLFKEELPKCLHYLTYNLTSRMSEVFEAIEKEYLPTDSSEDSWQSLRQALSSLLSDLTLTAGISKTADYLSSSGIATYVYKITHPGQFSLAAFKGGKHPNHTTHGDELFLQFNFLTPQMHKLNEDDSIVSKLIISLWTSFADLQNLEVTSPKSGESFMWEQYNANEPKYLEISLEPKMRSEKLCSKADFWTETVPKLIASHKTKKEEL